MAARGDYRQEVMSSFCTVTMVFYSRPGDRAPALSAIDFLTPISYSRLLELIVDLIYYF